MSKKHRDLTADEKKLWRRVAANVKTRRLPPTGAEEIEAEVERQPRASRPPSPPPKATARSKKLATPQNRGNERRVKRGQLEIGATLDLHGHTQDSARTALRRFLRAAQRRGDRAVIVVTGVGRAGEGVLKKRLPHWLSECDVAVLVSGYAPAHRSHGGAGAFYVFVKRAE